MSKIALFVTRSISLIVLILGIGCNSSDDAKDLIDTIDGPESKQIDTSRMGVNLFANQSFAGSVCSQFLDVRDTLRLNHVRVLFNWDDNVQPSPESTPNFSFYDDIVDCIPSGVDALVILTNVPSWMTVSSNWISGNPRQTFAQLWAKKVAKRYAGNTKIAAFQIWNEPNLNGIPANETIGVLTSPENFVELVSLSSNLIKDADPGRKIVSGSTSAIAQNFPTTLNYNKAALLAGLENFIDYFGVHYYGTNFEVFTLDVKDFLNSISKPIWVTESGRQGVNQQLDYVSKTWPFLREKVANIDRIYYYRYAENTSPEITFGLRNPSTEFPVSDLYIYLRDRE